MQSTATLTPDQRASVPTARIEWGMGLDSGATYERRGAINGLNEHVAETSPGRKDGSGKTTTSDSSNLNQLIPLTTASHVPRDEAEPVLLAEWEGYVATVSEHHFTAALSGVFGQGVEGVREDAQIPLSDVSRSDTELLQPGGIFRLCVFHTITPYGQPRRYTEVVFRRVPGYRPKDLAAARGRADTIHRSLRVE